MPFTVSWTVIPSGDLDPDSPITTELMTALYTNGVYLKEWIGNQAAATVNHAHAGLAVDGTALIATVPSHSHTGIEDASLTASGTDDNEFSTGSVGFAPQLAWVHGVFIAAGVYGYESVFAGVLRNTGSGAQSIAVTGASGSPGGNAFLSADADAAGGILTGGGPSTTHTEDLNCTQFSSGGIKFQSTTGPDGAWDVYVVAMRWSS